MSRLGERSTSSFVVLFAAQAAAGNGSAAGPSLKRGREDETPPETSADRAAKQLKVSSSPFSVPPLPPLDPTTGAYLNPYPAHP